MHGNVVFPRFVVLGTGTNLVPKLVRFSKWFSGWLPERSSADYALKTVMDFIRT